MKCIQKHRKKQKTRHQNISKEFHKKGPRKKNRGKEAPDKTSTLDSVHPILGYFFKSLLN
jgi:hypothetical protein